MDGNTSNEKDVEWVERWQKPDCLVKKKIWTLLAPSPPPAAASLIRFRSTGMPRQWWWPVLLLRDYLNCPIDRWLFNGGFAWPYFFLQRKLKESSLQVKAEEKTGKPESANRGEKAASTDERDITEELNWRAIFVISASAHWLDRTVCTFANSACKEVSP